MRVHEGHQNRELWNAAISDLPGWYVTCSTGFSTQREPSWTSPVSRIRDGAMEPYDRRSIRNVARSFVILCSLRSVLNEIDAGGRAS